MSFMTYVMDADLHVDSMTTILEGEYKSKRKPIRVLLLGVELSVSAVKVRDDVIVLTLSNFREPRKNSSEYDSI